jgi:hypothetical protein
MAAPGSDRRNALVIAAACAVGGLVLAGLAVWGASVLVPQVMAWAASVFSPGLGLKTSAIIAAVVAFLALIALTVTAGDGLLGEIQFVIPGFFLFFLFFWLMLAWVF